MTFHSTSTSCLLFMAISSAAVAQEGRVFIASSTDKELRRAAHQLHIPVSQLKNARELLQQATTLARTLDPIPAQRMGNLAQFWIEVDRPQAAANIESLLEYVRRAAAEASDAASFQQISMAFQGILLPLAELDPDRAVREARQWPRPPEGLDDGAADLRDQLIDQFLRQLVQRLVYRDPAKAASLYGDLNSSTATDYYTPGQLAMQLAGAGQKDRAYRLVDGVIDNYRSQAPTFDRFENFVGFVGQLPGLDPDRFMQAFSLIAAQSDMPVAGTLVGTLKVGDNSVQLNQFDLRMLDVFRSLSGRPELLQRALDALPGFTAKFDGVGGIDNALSPNLAGGGSSLTYSSDGEIIQSGPPLLPADHILMLFKELKGKATKDPEMVRKKLSQVMEGSEHIDLLLNLAQQTCYEDPDLGSIAVEVATHVVSKVESAQIRSILLQNLVQAARQCDGEVDPNLLREGFVVADQLRAEERDRNPGTVDRHDGNSQADVLEQALLGQVAVDHYQAALRYLSAMSDDEAKLAAQLHVIGALRQMY